MLLPAVPVTPIFVLSLVSTPTSAGSIFQQTVRSSNCETFVAVTLLLRAQGERVLGHAFDRPQPGAKKAKKPRAARVSPLRRYPLPRYVGARFLQLALLSFGVLLMAYLLIDMMDRMQWFARHHASGSEIVRFYGARVFLLASRAVPMAVLKVKATPIFQMKTAKIPERRARATMVSLVTALTMVRSFGSTSLGFSPRSTPKVMGFSGS